METSNDVLGEDFMSDAAGTVVKRRSVGQRVLDFLCDHKTTIVLSGCVVTLLPALVYVAKRYSEIKTENIELLNTAAKYAELKTEHTGVLKKYALLNSWYSVAGLPVQYYELEEQINELQNVARKKKTYQRFIKSEHSNVYLNLKLFVLHGTVTYYVLYVFLEHPNQAVGEWLVL